MHRPTFLRFGLWSAAGGLTGAMLQAALSGPALLAALMRGSRLPSSFVTVRPFPLDIPDIDCQV